MSKIYTQYETNDGRTTDVVLRRYLDRREVADPIISRETTVAIIEDLTDASLDIPLVDLPEDNEVYLAHYGVKGQKWGVRRTAAQLGRKGKKVAKRTAEFGKYSVTPQTDTLRGSLSGTKAKVFEVIAGRQEKQAKTSKALAKEFKDAADEIESSLAKNDFTMDSSTKVRSERFGRMAKRRDKRAKLLDKAAEAKDEEAAIHEFGSKEQKKLTSAANKLREGAKKERSYKETYEGFSKKRYESDVRLFREIETGMRKDAVGWSKAAKESRKKAAALRNKQTKSYKKQEKRNYGFGYKDGKPI